MFRRKNFQTLAAALLSLSVVAASPALVASALAPESRQYVIASHASTEPGARIALAHLGLVPLFDHGMRVGEGTGAVLGAALVRTAVSVQLSMATFATAGIVGRMGLVKDE